MIDRTVTGAELQRQVQESSRFLQQAFAREIKMAREQFQTSDFTWPEVVNTGGSVEGLGGA